MSNFVEFQNLFVKNLRSVDNVGIDIKFETGKTTVITSADNGSGKSSLWRDALFYVLFDKPYAKGQSKSQLINSRSDSNLLVRLQFKKGDVEYTVERGQKPSVFTISADGMPFSKEAVDFQKTLIKILGNDEKVFTNSIILGKHKFVPFTTMPAEDRRKYSDQILNLGILTKMSDDNKQLLKDLKAKYQSHQSSIAVLEVQCKSLKERIELKQSYAVEKIDTLTKTLEERLEKKKQLQEDLIGLESLLQNFVDRVATATNELETMRQGFKVQKAKLMETELENVAALSAKQNVQFNLNPEYDKKLQAIEHSRYELSNKKREFENGINEKQDEIKKINRLLGESVERLDALIEPKVGEVCSLCEGVVPVEKYEQQLKYFNDKQETINKVMVALNNKLANFANIDDELKAFATQQQESLSALKLEEDEIKRCIQADRDSHKENMDALNVAIAAARHRVDEISTGFDISNQGALDAANAKMYSAISEKNQAESNIQHNKAVIADVENNIKALSIELEGLKVDNTTHVEESKLIEFNSQLEQETNELKSTLKLISLREMLVRNLKDDGIKAKIVENYLPFVNSKINEYLEKMNFPVVIELNSNFELSMFAPDRKNQTLTSLSDGQQMRIDLAVLLAWRDVARRNSTASCNVLIMDEILESLSESGVIDFLELWNNSDESKYTNLVVISQRKSEFEPLFDTCHSYKLVDSATAEILEGD